MSIKSDLKKDGIEVTPKILRLNYAKPFLLMD